MSCEEIWREIPNYIGGKHGAAMRASIEVHFKDCKRCTAALGGAGNVVRLAADAATFDLRDLPHFRCRPEGENLTCSIS
jgi:hypothetical protein